MTKAMDMAVPEKVVEKVVEIPEVTRDPVIAKFLETIPENSRAFFDRMEGAFSAKVRELEEKARQKVDRARKDSESLRGRLIQMETFVEQQRAEVNRLTDELAKTKVPTQTGVAEVAQLRSENNELKLELSRRRNMTSTLRVREQTIDSLRAEVADLKQRLEQALQVDLRRDNEDLRQTLRGVRKRMADNEETWAASVRATGQRHAEEVQSWEAKVKAIQERADGFEKEAERLQKTVARLEKQAGAV